LTKVLIALGFFFNINDIPCHFFISFLLNFFTLEDFNTFYHNKIGSALFKIEIDFCKQILLGYKRILLNEREVKTLAFFGLFGKKDKPEEQQAQEQVNPIQEQTVTSTIETDLSTGEPAVPPVEQPLAEPTPSTSAEPVTPAEEENH